MTLQGIVESRGCLDSMFGASAVYKSSFLDAVGSAWVICVLGEGRCSRGEPRAWRGPTGRTHSGTEGHGCGLDRQGTLNNCIQ